VSGFLSSLGGLAPAGSSGNNTHTSVQLAPAADKTAIVFVTENAGTTVTITVQGSVDPDKILTGPLTGSRSRF
jgi:hypothetical protein